MANAIIGLACLFFASHFLNWLFIKTKIPDLLIITLIGYTAGPLLGLVKASDFGSLGALLSSLALVVILYEGGLNLSLKDLQKSSLPALKLSLFTFSFIAFIVFTLMYLLALQPLSTSLLAGVGLASTSSAVVVPLVKNLPINENTKTILSLESVFTDVLAIVIFLVLLDGFSQNNFDFKQLAIGVGPNTLIATLLGLFLGIAWGVIQKNYSTFLPKAFSGEAWAFLSYGFIEVLGYNGAIGVLALGFMLANFHLLPSVFKEKTQSLKPQDLSLLHEISFLLRTVFFLLSWCSCSI